MVKDSYGVWDQHVYTDVFKMVNPQVSTVQYSELCSVLCGNQDGRKVWGRMETCICMAESLCCPPETVTTLLIGSTPI